MSNISPSSPLPERRYDVVLSAASAAKRFWGLLLFAVVWNLGCGVVVGAIMMNAGDRVPTFAKFILSIFVLVGVGFIVYLVKETLARRKLHAPLITLSAQPLCVGEKFSGGFRQQAKSPAQIERVTLRLICRERATYGSGTNKTTVTHDVYTDERTCAHNVTANSVQPIGFEFDFEIPPDAMHSFSANWNSIEWFLELRTEVASWPDYSFASKIDVVAIRYREQAPVA